MAADDVTEPPERRGASVFLERRTLVMLALGFSAGLPNLLLFDTLSAWLREAGLSLEVIGFFSLATLAYSFKFLWAPLVDRTAVPGLTGWLGHRRSWMLATQALIVAGLLLIAGTDPAQSLGTLALLAVLVGFASATQDIVIDAWRIEVADTARQGALAAAYQWGYRIAIIVAGAAPLLMAEHYGWNLSYGAMAALMGIGVAACLAAPRERETRVRPIPTEGLPARPAAEAVEWALRLGVLGGAALLLGSGLTGDASLLGRIGAGLGAPDAAAALVEAWKARPDGVVLQVSGVLAGLGLIVVAAWPVPGVRTRPGTYLSHSFGAPLGDFFARFGRTSVVILLLICSYRLADFVLNIMNPFYLDLGFTKTEIAEVRKVFGVAMSMLGVFAGGWSVVKLGVLRTLLVGAFAGPISNLVFAWLATRGPDLGALFVAIGTDNLASGFAGTALIAYMSSLTSGGFTATQYALFSSLYALPGKLVASQSGRIVEGAARSAESGGVLAGLQGLFANLPPTALAEGAAKAGVGTAALGAGYVAFFLYSCVIGLGAIVLTVIVAAKGEGKPAAQARDSA